MRQFNPDTAYTLTVGELLERDNYQGPHPIKPQIGVSPPETSETRTRSTWAYEREREIAFELEQAELAAAVGRALCEAENTKDAHVRIDRLHFALGATCRRGGK